MIDSEKVIQDYLEGMSVIEIAKKFGVSEELILDILREAGHELQTDGGPNV